MTDPKLVPMINKNIGKKLGKTIEARGITRADLAQATGITEARLNRVIKGSSELTAAQLVIAAKALGVPIQTLVF